MTRSHGWRTVWGPLITYPQMDGPLMTTPPHGWRPNHLPPHDWRTVWGPLITYPQMDGPKPPPQHDWGPNFLPIMYGALITTPHMTGALTSFSKWLAPKSPAPKWMGSY